MEAVLLHPALDQPISSNNNHHIRGRKNNIHHTGFVSRSSENFAPVHSDLVSNIHGGLGYYFGHQLPNMSSSFSSYSYVPVFNSNQPPLLPLPVTKPYSSLPVRTNNNMNKCVPFSPIINNKKNNNNRIREQDHHLKQKKSRSQSTSPKKQNNNPPKQDSKNLVVISSTKRLGPEPSDLPKGGVSRVLKPLPSSTTTNFTATSMEGSEKEEEFSGSIFSLAPPPSSLPLPKFSLRPKLVPCNVEAASGIDDGATDNLRRLLRLR